LDLFLAYYEDQRAGESLHSPRHCLPGTGWEVLDHRTVAVSVNGLARSINQYTIQRERDKLIVLYWYQSRRRTLASEYAGKFWLMWDGVLAGDTGAAIVRVTLPPALLPEGLAFAGALIGDVGRVFNK
jgi:EpsI family protein